MSANSIKTYFLEKLKKHDLSDIEGARLTFHIPMHENFLNFVLETTISDPKKMNDFKEVRISDMSKNEFRVKIDHKLINKNIRCKISPIEFNSYSERELIIEFLGGIKFYEKALLRIFGNVKSGWSAFKKAMKDEDESHLSGPFWKISGSKVKINLDAFLRKQGLAFMIPLVDWKDIITKNNSLIIDFELKATQYESNLHANN